MMFDAVALALVSSTKRVTAGAANAGTGRRCVSLIHESLLSKTLSLLRIYLW
jgi:hypothetical protein